MKKSEIKQHIIAFALAALVVGTCTLCSCANGGLHGKGYANVTGSVTDPTNPQYNVGGEVDFAKRHRTNSSGK